MLRHLFLHIQKAGGTSVVENLWKPAVPVAERYLEDDLVAGGASHGEPHTYFEMSVVSHVYGLPYRDVFAAFWNAGKLPRHCRLYSGHFGYGIHEVIGGPCRYCTVIRQPVGRVISHFNLLKSLDFFDGDFGQYLTSGKMEVDNYQVRALTRRGFCHAPVAEGDLHEAIHNLTSGFDFCVTEHLDEFVDGMIEQYRLPIENCRVVANRTADATHVKGSPHIAHQQFPVDPDLLPRLAEMNYLDMRLYEFAKRVSAERWLQVAGFGPRDTPKDDADPPPLQVRHEMERA